MKQDLDQWQINDLNDQLAIIKTSKKFPVEFKEKFVSALRSGEFKQGHLRLYQPDTDTYCCLGVAAHIIGLQKERMIGKAVISKFDFPSELECNIPEAFLSGTVMNSSDLQKALYALNDQFGYTFEEIATVIEENL